MRHGVTRAVVDAQFGTVRHTPERDLFPRSMRGGQQLAIRAEVERCRRVTSTQDPQNLSGRHFPQGYLSATAGSGEQLAIRAEGCLGPVALVSAGKVAVRGMQGTYPLAILQAPQDGIAGGFSVRGEDACPGTELRF